MLWRSVLCGIVLLCSASLAVAQTTTETWTHADQAGNLSADLPWTQWSVSGNAWGIVSNQASITGSGEAWARADLDATSANMTVQSTLVSMSTPTSGNVQGGVYATKDSTTTKTLYGFSAFKAVGQNDFYYLFKYTNNSSAQIGAIAVMPVVNGVVMKLVIDRTAGTIQGYVNNVLVVSGTDNTLPNNVRGGVWRIGTDPNATVVFDTWSVTPAGGPPPPQLSATLSWLPGSVNDNIASYTIYRLLGTCGQAGSTTLLQTIGVTTTYLDNTIPVGTAGASYEITASNSFGESGHSTRVCKSFTADVTPPAPPSNIRIQ